MIFLNFFYSKYLTASNDTVDQDGCKGPCSEMPAVGWQTLNLTEKLFSARPRLYTVLAPARRVHQNQKERLPPKIYFDLSTVSLKFHFTPLCLLRVPSGMSTEVELVKMNPRINQPPNIERRVYPFCGPTVKPSRVERGLKRDEREKDSDQKYIYLRRQCPPEKPYLLQPTGRCCCPARLKCFPFSVFSFFFTGMNFVSIRGKVSG